MELHFRIFSPDSFSSALFVFWQKNDFEQQEQDVNLTNKQTKSYF